MDGLSSSTFESPCLPGRVRARVCAFAFVCRYVGRMRNSHEVVFRDDFNQSFVSKTTYGVEASFKLPPGLVLHASYSFTNTTVCRPCGADSHALSTLLCRLLHQVRACSRAIYTSTTLSGTRGCKATPLSCTTTSPSPLRRWCGEECLVGAPIPPFDPDPGT
jgi:hypothetical protein